MKNMHSRILNILVAVTLFSVFLTAILAPRALASPSTRSYQPVQPEIASMQSPAAASSQSLALGPDQFPKGVNPLTGLTVKDPALLSLPPALVSVSNFPVSARPQAGLSYAPYVFEMYIGEGMTRFLALFYGQFPEIPPDAATSSTAQSGISTGGAMVGPIRSGRLPYQSLRSLYNGFLVMSSASEEVRPQLTSSTNIYGSDKSNINSALVDVNKLKALAQANLSEKPLNLSGNLFNFLAPPGGQNAPKLWVFYNYYNQVLWTYDLASQVYLRSQDKSDGSGIFYPSTDSLTGQQLAFDNIIVLYAKHTVLNTQKTLIDLDLFYTKNKAYLFRNGKVYPLYWTTASGDYEKKTGQLRPIRFVDRDDKPFALKPGKTWVEIVDVTATMQEKEPGFWKARFYSP